MLKELKDKVYEANLDLVKHGLVIFTWGNVSGIDRERELIAIKPSGIDYEKLTPKDIVVVDLEGKVVEGNLKPSSDTPTHIELYKSFLEIGGVSHTHSTYATSWAQAGEAIPVIGTTHADYFSQDIPCTPDMTLEEIKGSYEKETGKLIVRSFHGINPLHLPGVLVKNHGPFTWGKTPGEAVQNSVVLEQIAQMAYLSYTINPNLDMNQPLVDKHYKRKHGDNAYYGQNETE